MLILHFILSGYTPLTLVSTELYQQSAFEIKVQHAVAVTLFKRDFISQFVPKFPRISLPSKNSTSQLSVFHYCIKF